MAGYPAVVSTTPESQRAAAAIPADDVSEHPDVSAGPESAWAQSTVVVAAGRPPREQGAPLNPPVVLTSTYFSVGKPGPGERVYTRYGTETWDPLEEAIAALEGASRPGLVFASGMAAVAAVMSLVPPGGRIVMPRHTYQVALQLANELTSRSAITVDLVDVADTTSVLAALDTGGRVDLLWLESPTNPMLEVADLAALAAAGRAAGAIVAVDNTFATPLGQRPLALGADVVVHSVTKYLAGHSDVVLGAVVVNDPDLADRVIAYRGTHGAIAGPWEAWLALRGLRTLALRVDRSTTTAQQLAERLSAHPDVLEVRYPGLPDDPGHDRAARQMTGFGSIIALRPRGGLVAAEALASTVRLWVPATSLGGVESSLERRRRFYTESTTVPEDLVRLSVGIEDLEDLWADLDQGLRAAQS
jgi:cystathionine gamma-synthase